MDELLWEQNLSDLVNQHNNGLYQVQIFYSYLAPCIALGAQRVKMDRCTQQAALGSLGRE